MSSRVMPRVTPRASRVSPRRAVASFRDWLRTVRATTRRGPSPRRSRRSARWRSFRTPRTARTPRHIAFTKSTNDDVTSPRLSPRDRPCRTTPHCPPGSASRSIRTAAWSLPDRRGNGEVQKRPTSARRVGRALLFLHDFCFRFGRRVRETRVRRKHAVHVRRGVARIRPAFERWRTPRRGTTASSPRCFPRWLSRRSSERWASRGTAARSRCPSRWRS